MVFQQLPFRQISPRQLITLLLHQALELAIDISMALLSRTSRSADLSPAGLLVLHLVLELPTAALIARSFP